VVVLEGQQRREVPGWRWLDVALLAALGRNVLLRHADA
jgi:hypothetical protein